MIDDGRVCVEQIFILKQIGEKTREKKRRVYVGFMDLGKAYDIVNREALWQVLRMYDVDGKLLGGIKSMYVDGLAFFRVKEVESEYFRIDNGARQGCTMSRWLFNVCMDAMKKEVKMGMGRRGVRFLEKGREPRLSGLSYADDLVLCDESEEDLFKKKRFGCQASKENGAG